MKRILIFALAVLLCCSILLPTVYADGMIVTKNYYHDNDEWQLFDENQQNCAINYKDGIQNMILKVSIGKNLNAEKAAWLFPIPAEPQKTVIDVIK